MVQGYHIYKDTQPWCKDTTSIKICSQFLILGLSKVYLYALTKLKYDDIVVAFLQYTHARSFNGN